jgi:hypothetical protein
MMSIDALARLKIEPGDRLETVREIVAGRAWSLSAGLSAPLAKLLNSPRNSLIHVRAIRSHRNRLASAAVALSDSF